MKNDYAVSRLTQLDADLDEVIEFARSEPEEKKSHLVRNALVGAGGLAAAYGAGSFMRGRAARLAHTGKSNNSFRGIGQNIAVGHSMNVSDVKNAVAGAPGPIRQGYDATVEGARKMRQAARSRWNNAATYGRQTYNKYRHGQYGNPGMELVLR